MTMEPAESPAVLTRTLAVYVAGASAVLYWALTVAGVVPVAPVSVSHVAEAGLTVAVYAKSFPLFEATLICPAAGAVPFAIAIAEIPLSGPAVSPTALIVPVMPTVPLWPRIVYDVNDAGALKLADPNDSAESEASGGIVRFALNEFPLAPKVAEIWPFAKIDTVPG
jgi:hypothetical protein